MGVFHKAEPVTKPVEAILPGVARPVAAKVLIIVPARDEAETVGRVVRDVRAHSECDIVVIDDCSTDRTADVAQDQGAAVLRLPIWVGAWGAVQTGFRYALDQGYTMAISMDADGQHRAASLEAVSKPVSVGRSDVVVGVCPHRASLSRRIVWGAFRQITGLTTMDITSGLRAYNSNAMRLLISDNASMLNYQDIGVLLMLRAQGLHVTEVPVWMETRKHGHSRVYANWGLVIAYVMETLMLSTGKWRPSWHLQQVDAARKVR
jgi:glycosyltransferase involved in cell wall biosynthesis